MLINLLSETKDATERELIVDIITSLPAKVLQMISKYSMSYIIDLAKSMEIEKSDNFVIHWCDKISTKRNENRVETEQKKCIQCICEKMDDSIEQMIQFFIVWVMERKGKPAESIVNFIDFFERFGIDNDKLSEEKQARNLIRLVSQLKLLETLGYTISKSVDEIIGGRRHVVMVIENDNEMKNQFITLFGNKYNTTIQENSEMLRTSKDNVQEQYSVEVVNGNESLSLSMLISHNLNFPLWETPSKPLSPPPQYSIDEDILMKDSFNLPEASTEASSLPETNQKTINLFSYDLLDHPSPSVFPKQDTPSSSSVSTCMPQVPPLRKCQIIESFPFKGNFTHVHEIKSTEFGEMQDIQISYKNKLIILSNVKNGNNTLIFIDLKTKALKKSISFYDTIKGIAIERGFDGKNDAIILTTEENIIKYDISKLVQSGNHRDYLWSKKMEISTRYNLKNAKLERLTVLHTKNKSENVVLACDTNYNCIHILRTSDGKVLKRIGGVDSKDKQTLFHPKCIAVNRQDSELVISETSSNTVRVLLESSETKTSEIRTLPTKFKQVGGLVFDNASKNIIVSDTIENSIQIFNSIGNRVNILKDQIYCPKSLCINEESGELLVNDSKNNRIVIYK